MQEELLGACSLGKQEGTLSVKEEGLVMGSVGSQQMCSVIKGGVLEKFLDLCCVKQM